MLAHRVGILGGTFDPIHFGHLHAARAVAASRNLTQVLFAPAGEPWHRAQQPIASREERAAMVSLAIAGEPSFALTRVDLDRVGPTFTIDTLTDLRAWFAQVHPGQTVEWTVITGADALAGMREWRDPEGILRLAHVVGVARPGHHPDVDLPWGNWSRLNVPGVDISATQVRRAVAAGEPIEGLVPGAVAEFIRQHGLYRDATP